MTVSYAEVLAERFPAWQEVVLEQPLPPLAARSKWEPSDPACQAHIHRTWYAWGSAGCVCRDEIRWAAYVERIRKNRRARYKPRKRRRSWRHRLLPGTPSILGADWPTAMAIVYGHHMPAARNPDRRLAAILLYRRAVPVAEIAHRIGKTERTVYRYLHDQSRRRCTPGRRLVAA